MTCYRPRPPYRSLPRGVTTALWAEALSLFQSIRKYWYNTRGADSQPGFYSGLEPSMFQKKRPKRPPDPPAAVHSLGSCQEAQALHGALTLQAAETCFSLNLNAQLWSYKCEHFISVTANVLQQKTRVNKITNYPVLPPLILKAKRSFKPWALYIDH